MKKIIIIFVINLIICPVDAWAKDTVFSINKYKEETLSFVMESYNKDNKNDGLIVGGSYLKEDKEKEEEDNNDNKDYQIIVVKYSKIGKILWKYTYGKTKEDKIDELIYTYNENGIVDGYLIVLEKTYDVGESIADNASGTTLIKLDLDGKLVWEKDSTIGKRERIKKLIPIFKEDKTLDYYIGIGSVKVDGKDKAVRIKYDRDLNLIWEKELEEESIIYTDIVPIYNESKVEAFALLKEKVEDTKSISIVKIDVEGNDSGVIEEGLEEYDSYQLSEADTGFLLYGITSDVKLKKGEKSYYILKYNLEGNDEWESIGEIPIDEEKSIQLLHTKKDNKINKYFLQYINPVDSKLEVIELDIDGLFQKKIKKINADYYTIENFLIDGDTLYFVGQINCQDDDSCDYDSNSLFLISDEDKVIEVEDSDSTNIIVITMLIVVGVVGLFLIKRKRSLNNN